MHFVPLQKRHFFRSIGFRLIPSEITIARKIVKFSKSQLLQNDRRFASWLPPSLKSFLECMMTSLHFSLIKTTFWKKGALCLTYHVLDGKNYFWLSDFFVLIKREKLISNQKCRALQFAIFFQESLNRTPSTTTDVAKSHFRKCRFFLHTNRLLRMQIALILTYLSKPKLGSSSVNT